MFYSSDPNLRSARFVFQGAAFREVNSVAWRVSQ